MDTQSAVIVSTIGATGLNLLARLHRNGPSGENARVLVGGFVLGAVLMLVAEFWPDGAQGLAVVVLVTSAVLNGADAFRLITSLVD